MKSFFTAIALACATSAITLPEKREATPATYGNYGNYGKYGKYGNYGAYSRSAEAETDIEALLNLASAIKGKREAEAEAFAEG